MPNSVVNPSVTRRSALLVTLIVLVTLFWVLMLTYTNLPTIALVVLGAVSLVLISVATAWTAMALPKAGESNEVT